MSDIKEDLKNIILNTKEPLILRKFLKWDIFNWNLQKWSTVLKNEVLELRRGVNLRTNNPQWERSTPIINGNFTDLLTLTDQEQWLYFDYKYLHEWLLNAEELRENIKFEDLGLTQIKADDSTIWIGTKGAHTPCHIDTYGCNVVVQAYGRKQWMLFPPNEDLKCTRVPYEESSIYSKFNFFSPTVMSDFKEISYCKIIVLDPGDVLIVPHKWWHYVENLEMSISINTWLPLPEDNNERQKECLVQMLIGFLIKDLNKERQDSILNPNQDNNMCQSLDSGLSFLNQLVNISGSLKKQEDGPSNFNVEEVIHRHNFISKIKWTSQQEFQLFLQNQSNRFTNLIDRERKQEIDMNKFICALTHPDVIKVLTDKLLD